MSILTKAATIGAIASLLIGAALPAWCGSGVTRPFAADAAASSSSALTASTASRWFEPSADARPAAMTNCQPGHLYTQHDTVGDPQSCIMEGYTIAGSYGAIAGIGMVP